MGTYRRTFSDRFRREAVELLRVSGKSANALAKELGVPQTVLSRWKRAAARTEDGDGTLQALETTVHELRRENARLRMEREILKKATAFFAAESL